MKRLLLIPVLIAASAFCLAASDKPSVYVVKVQTKMLGQFGMPFPANAPDMLQVFVTDHDATVKGLVISVSYESQGTSRSMSKMIENQNGPSVAIFNVDDVTSVKVKSVTVDELKTTSSQETDF